MTNQNLYKNTILREIKTPTTDVHGNGCLYEVLLPDSNPEKWVPIPTVLGKVMLKRGAKLKEETSLIKRLLDEKIQNLFCMQDRWEDEKEYEDFKDYQKVIEDMFKEYGFSDIKLFKSFRITAKTPEGKHIEIKIFKSGKVDITE